MQVLLTRPLEDSRALAETLELDGIDALIWPLTRIVPTVTALKLPFTTGGLLFTSANGVRTLAALIERRDLPALCVGKATADAARKAGFRDCFSASGDARALADLARRSGLRDFFHPRGHDAAGDLKGWLAETGHRVTEAVLYQAQETGPPPAQVAALLTRGEINLVTIWSSRGAAILARHLAKAGAALQTTDLLAISPAAAEPLEISGFRQVVIAEAPDGAAMLTKIRAYFATEPD
ncbi:MAG TPA: uroporphyrinogen-III synthase [Thermohalobaculum sp.]|nr:uroporphyrinogen-III synthase [Thermohalobaculum sp.]